MRNAVRVSLEIAAAIESGHAKGILHRDLKPDNNTLLTASGAKLLVFGLGLIVVDEEATHTTATSIVFRRKPTQ